MSKHIQRGRVGMSCVHIERVKKFQDCTMIHDALCFPVTEARELCLAHSAVHAETDITKLGFRSKAVHTAYEKYRDAVEKMKSKQLTNKRTKR